MANREFGGKIRSKRSHTLSKPYEKRKSFLNKFTDTVKDILVPSWLSDFMKGKSTTENLQNNLVEEQNGNEVEENEENDNYLTPQDGSTVGDRRPAQPHPLHPEFSSYHQSQNKSISRRPNLPNYGNDHHMLPTSHKMQYHPPDPRFSTPINPSVANDVLLAHTDNSEAYSSPLLEKCNYLHLSEADVDQLRNRLHPANDTNASTHLQQQQQQATDDSEFDEEEASGSASVEQDDGTADLDQSESWNSSYLKGKNNNRGGHDKRPSFEPSLFGSPFMKSSLLSDSLHESSFYAGKTRYGGAAANRKLRLKVSSPYTAAMPYRKQVNAKPLKSSSSAVTSSTAKRILDTLEMMATPLSDAHRIPMANNTFTDSVLQFTPSSLKRRNRPTIAASMFSVNSQMVPSRGPPSVMSNSPSIATIARNRQPLHRSLHSDPKRILLENTKSVEKNSVEQEKTNRPVERLIDNVTPKSKTFEPKVREPTLERLPTREPTPDKTPLSRLAPSPLNPRISTPFTEKNVESPSTFESSTRGKMKRDKSYSLRPSGTRADEDDEEEPVHLETKFILPVKDMPKFSFGSNLSAPTKSSEPPSTSTPLARPPLNSSSVTSTSVTSATSSRSPDLFTFSSPILNKAPIISHSSASNLDFKFSSPAKVIESAETAQQTFQFSPASTLPKPKMSASSTGLAVSPELKSGSVLEALSGDKIDTSTPNSNNFSPGFLTAKTLKTSGSVMDVLGATNKSLSKSSAPPFSSGSGTVFGGLQPATTLKTGSVMDILGKSSETTSTTATTESEPDPFMAKFVKPAGTWECDTCMIQNNSDITKCVACETPKPTPASQPPKSVSSSITKPLKPDELMSKFLKPPGAWECDTCLVQNEAENQKCCVCETLRASQTAAPISDAAVTASQKVDPLMAKFLKPTGSWECSVCMIQNKSSDRKCVACETPNPDAPPEPADANGLGVAVTSSSMQSSSQSLASAATDKLDKPLSVWKCDTCLVSNPPQFQKCIACDTPHIKPAVKATMAAISSGSADVLPKFGAGVVTSTNFKFGIPSGSSASSTTTTTTASTGGFKFGSTASSEATGGFKFGVTTTTTAAATSSTSSTETSNMFTFGQSAAAVDEKKKSSENSGFKFGASSNSSLTTSTAPFPFGTEIKKTSVGEETSKESGFTFSQPSSDFPYATNKDKTSESTVSPLFGASVPPATGSVPFINTPLTSTANKASSEPSTIAPTSTTSQSFSFSSVTNTAPTAIFSPPQALTSGKSALPSTSPFGSQPVNSLPQQSSKPLFGFTAKADSGKIAEVPASQPFLFGAASNESNKRAEKTPFSPTSLKTNEDECDGPSDAKRAFGSSSLAPAAATTGGFGGFSFNAGSTTTKSNTSSSFTNSFNAAPSGQFAFGATGNSPAPTPFGSGNVTTTTATTTAASSFGSPSFNFASGTATTPKPMAMASATSTTSQPFVFGSNPPSFSAGASSENTFGNKGSVFGTAGASASLFDNKSATSKPFGAPPAASPAANAPFVFGSSAPSFNFSASGTSQGNVFQFTAKQSEATPASANPNLYQFGQTASTNNAPLGANSSSTTSSGINFNTKPNVNFAAGIGGEFTLGSSGEGSSSNTRKFKKAVRRKN